jgi:hypothetical protein
VRNMTFYLLRRGGGGGGARQERLEIVQKSCPGPGACGGMYTANTMATAIEALGMSLPYSSSMPADSKCVDARLLPCCVRTSDLRLEDVGGLGLCECPAMVQGSMSGHAGTKRNVCRWCNKHCPSQSA